MVGQELLERSECYIVRTETGFFLRVLNFGGAWPPSPQLALSEYSIGGQQIFFDGAEFWGKGVWGEGAWPPSPQLALLHKYMVRLALSKHSIRILYYV